MKNMDEHNGSKYCKRHNIYLNSITCLKLTATRLEGEAMLRAVGAGLCKNTIIFVGQNFTRGGNIGSQS